jgi:hypothetical protein
VAEPKEGDRIRFAWSSDPTAKFMTAPSAYLSGCSTSKGNLIHTMTEPIDKLDPPPVNLSTLSYAC